MANNCNNRENTTSFTGRNQDHQGMHCGCTKSGRQAFSNCSQVLQQGMTKQWQLPILACSDTNCLSSCRASRIQVMRRPEHVPTASHRCKTAGLRVQAARPSLRGFEERLPRHGVVERLALKSPRYFGSEFRGAGTSSEPGQKP